MCKFSESSKRKLGNAVIYIAERAKYPYKTEVLKLLFLMEEQMVVRYHVPFLGIPYHVWRLGPVSIDVYEELSDEPQLLDNFVVVRNTGKGNLVIPKDAFCDDEFSDKEISVMEDVMQKYGYMTSEQLIDETHREGSLWWKAAKENGLLEDFNAKRANCSNVVLDFGEELCGDARFFYEETLNIRQTANAMRP